MKAVIPQGDVHNLRLQDLAFFDHLPPPFTFSNFYGIKVYNKSFFTTYPPSLVPDL